MIGGWSETRTGKPGVHVTTSGPLTALQRALETGLVRPSKDRRQLIEHTEGQFRGQRKTAIPGIDITTYIWTPPLGLCERSFNAADDFTSISCTS